MAILSLLLLSLTAYAADPAPKAQSGMDAYSALQSGNARFAEGHALHPNQDPARREVVATAQHPLAIVISCSDSRVPPETIFDQGLGDLFTVRLAGNVMGPEAIASVEYAVEHLGARLLVVLGHDSCGAVAAAVQAKTGSSNGSPSLDALVKEIRSGLTAPAIQQAAEDKTMSLAVKENVTASLRHLLQHSEIVRAAIAKGQLVAGQAIYSLQTGKVTFWDVGKDTETLQSTDRPVLHEQTVTEEVIAPDFPKKKKAKKPVKE